jgi:hypothetical protein
MDYMEYDELLHYDTLDTLDPMYDVLCVQRSETTGYPPEGTRIRILTDFGNDLCGLHHAGEVGIYQRYIGRNVIVFDDDTWYDCCPMLFEVVDDVPTE